jgi:hypothetical protein
MSFEPAVRAREALPLRDRRTVEPRRFVGAPRSTPTLTEPAWILGFTVIVLLTETRSVRKILSGTAGAETPTAPNSKPKG